MFDPYAIRKDFPILARRVRDDQPLVYLDNAATTQKPRQVIQALVDYYERSNANIHRGVHALAEEATELYEGVREQVRAFINAPAAASIIFTRNTTESINLVAKTWGRANLKPGDEIVTTPMEHHSNLVPWQQLTAETGAHLRFIPLTPAGTLDLSHIDEVIGPRTKLLAITHMSNVLGTINPVEELIAKAHRRGAVAVIDGAQSVAHLPVDVQALDADFLAFSAHKMAGPTGVGVLYGRQALLEEMLPFLGGGDMIGEVFLDHYTPNVLPWKFEAGTPNIADVVAFGATLDYLSAVDMAALRQHEQDLVAYALDRLGQDPLITIYGPRDPAIRGGVVSFNYADVHPHDVGQLVDEQGVAIRVGHHCCQPLMRELDIHGTARASFYLYTIKEEIDRLAVALGRVKEVFARVLR